MAKQIQKTFKTKKHLARQERERRQIRLMLFVLAVIVFVIVGVIGYGILDQTYLKGVQPVAIVNGEKVTVNDYQAQVRYTRQQLISNAINTYQLIQIMGQSGGTQASFINQLSQIKAQLIPNTVGRQVLDQMVSNTLIRQEAKRREITVSQDEIEKALKDAFGFYPDGTPTSSPTFQPKPTSTLSAEQIELIPPTSTNTPTPTITLTAIPTTTVVITATSTPTTVPTITPTDAPSPTPTRYTLEGYQSRYDETVTGLEENIDFTEQDLIYLIENQLYYEKIKDVILDELNLSQEQEQVWARHILVEDEQIAEEVINRLKDGEEWAALSAELSTDTSNKDNGGDLGWFSEGRMVAEFEQAAFDLDISEISKPVQTQFGWHIIQVLGHELREISNAQYGMLQDQKLQEWLTELKDQSDIETFDLWMDIVPTEPIFPPELDQLINQDQQNPAIIPPQPTPE